jgi:hypothetical protein
MPADVRRALLDRGSLGQVAYAALRRGPNVADNPLVKKMKLAPGFKAAVLGSPPGYVRSLKLPSGTSVSEKLSGCYDWIQLFVKNKDGLEAKIGRTAKALSPPSLLWITFPKGSSGDPDRPHPGQGLGFAQGARPEVDQPDLGRLGLVGLRSAS